MNTFKMYCKRRKSGARFPDRKANNRLCACHCIAGNEASTNAVARWMRSWPSGGQTDAGCLNMLKLQTFWSQRRFSSASISKERRTVMFFHWPIPAYQHNETWWPEESAVFFHRHFRLIVRSIGTQGRQGVGKMYWVGEEGETPKEKSGVLDFNAWISLCTTLRYVRQGSLGSVSKSGGWNQRTFSWKPWFPLP